ncbi:MAG: hypothetical protein HGA19_14880, partial [Oscillochloris sp.]|nr:hypothetical protein [Oscillochloris sp.]
LSLTATNDEKRAAIGATRQGINDYLDGLHPEEDVDLTRLQAVAMGVPNVLRVVFKPEDCSVLDSEGKPISDKIRDRVVSVDPFEKVYLSESAFIIQA